MAEIPVVEGNAAGQYRNMEASPLLTVLEGGLGKSDTIGFDPVDFVPHFVDEFSELVMANADAGLARIYAERLGRLRMVAVDNLGFGPEYSGVDISEEGVGSVFASEYAVTPMDIEDQASSLFDAFKGAGFIRCRAGMDLVDKYYVPQGKVAGKGCSVMDCCAGCAPFAEMASSSSWDMYTGTAAARVFLDSAVSYKLFGYDAAQVNCSGRYYDEVKDSLFDTAAMRKSTEGSQELRDFTTSVALMSLRRNLNKSNILNRQQIRVICGGMAIMEAQGQRDRLDTERPFYSQAELESTISYFSTLVCDDEDEDTMVARGLHAV